MDLEEFKIKCRDYLENFVPFDEEQKIFVAGGFFPRFYHNLPIRDIDVYINDPELFKKMEEYYIAAGYTPDYEGGESLFNRFTCYDSSSPDIEIIGFHAMHEKFKENPYDYVSEFDFTVCQVIMNFESMDLISYNASTFSDIRTKTLRLNKKWSPKMKNNYSTNNVISRLLKYRDLGFMIDSVQVSDMYDKLIKYGAKEEKKFKFIDV